MQQRQFNRESGISIIEVIIAIGVLSILALGSATLMSDMSRESARSRRVQSRGNFEKTMVALYQKTDLCTCNLGTAALAVPSTGSVAITGLKSGCTTATNDFYDASVAGGFPVDTHLKVESIAVSNPQFISGNDYSATVTINYADSTTLGSLKPGKYIFLFTKTAAAGPPYVVSTCTLGGAIENGSGISWSLTGNVGTSSVTNFLGTTDNADLIFRRNSVMAGSLRTTSTSFGLNALANNTSGGSNTALGTNALHGNTTGSFNIGIGIGAGGLASDVVKQDVGNNNIYIGNGAGPSTSPVNGSVAIGLNAKVERNNAIILGGGGADQVNVGIGTPDPFTTLHIRSPNAVVGNIGFGGLAQDMWFDGGTDNEFFIANTGAATGRTLFAAPSTGAFILSLQNDGNVSIGGLATTTYKLNVDGDINISLPAAGLRFGGTTVCTSAGCTAVSDRRLKEDIKPLENSFDRILSLQGVSYNWIDREKYGHREQIGLIAQDLEKIYPQAVVKDERSGLRSVAYDHLIAPLIEAFKTLVRKFNSLEAKVTDLFGRTERLDRENKELRARLELLEQRLGQLENNSDRKEKR